jgi:hypothetical protein
MFVPYVLLNPFFQLIERAALRNAVRKSSCVKIGHGVLPSFAYNDGVVGLVPFQD